MSLYNLVFGKSEHADKLLALLGLARDDFYRFRDCYLSEGGEIAVYTRSGGGNREDGEVARDVLVQHPCYLRDADDDFDCTYATFYFRVPELADRDALAGIQPEIARNEAWVAFLEALKARPASSEEPKGAQE